MLVDDSKEVPEGAAGAVAMSMGHICIIYEGKTCRPHQDSRGLKGCLSAIDVFIDSGKLKENFCLSPPSMFVAHSLVCFVLVLQPLRVLPPSISITLPVKCAPP
jgi:hypothetical protein